MSDFSRRTFVKGLTGALALGSISGVGGHPAGGSHDVHEHHARKNTELVGFHSLGGVGSESFSGKPADAMTGVISEVWVEDDLAFVSFLSSSEPTGNRGIAILDVSGYTRAESREELRNAEMTVLSFIGNETEAGTAADVKVSDDGQYLFYSKQTIGWDYGEEASPSTEDHDAVGPDPTGVEAYDISDPGDPEYLGSGQGPATGFHNCFTHRIGGDHYVFGVQGLAPGHAGVHIYRLNEEGGLELVNVWNGENVRQGGYHEDGTGPYASGYYSHDFYAHDDPKTGRPLGYLAFWDSGVRVLDLSDPENVEELGVGEMSRAHYAQPAPALIDGKRVFVGGQEHGDQTTDISGQVRLFDADGIFEDDEGDEDGPARCPELDTWTLYEEVTYEGYAFSPHNADVTEDGWITQAHYHAGVRFLKIQPPGEGDVATGEWHIAGKRYEIPGGDRYDVDVEDEAFSGIIGPGAFGTTRTSHEFTPPAEADIVDATLSWTENTQDNDLYLEKNVSGDPENPEWEEVANSRTLSGPEQLAAPVESGTLHRFVVETFANAAAEYQLEGEYFGLTEKGDERVVAEDGLAYYRDHVEVPEETKTLDRTMSPNFWGARIENGVTFASGINTGLYAIAADPVPVGTRDPVAIDVERRDDGVAFTGDATNRIVYEVETDTEVTLRDRLPASWEVVGGDAATTRETGDGTQVVFDEPIEPHADHGHDHGDDDPTTRKLYVKVGTDVGASQVGPVRYSTTAEPSAGGKDWEPVPGTVETDFVGPSQP